MPLRPRPEIENLAMCPHGGPNYTELQQLGFAPEDVLDFSVSANPYGPPPGTNEALKSAVVDRYPDSDSGELRQALAHNLDLSPENIIVGNGSMELIRIVASAYFDKKDTVLITEPTFGEYEIACQIAGTKIIKHDAREEDGFQLSVDELAISIKQNQPKAVFLCNPNNPTGQYLNREEVERILSVCENTLLILDEAYVNFVDSRWRSLDLIDRYNLIVIRSMTKDYALAGLRLGYAVANPEVINVLRRVCPPWNVNAIAQSAGIAALRDVTYLEHCRKDIREARDYLRKELSKIGLDPVSSQVHFFLIKVGDATEFRRGLLQHGIMVRDCTSFGLPEYIRIASRSFSECKKLIDAIAMIR